MNETFAAVLKMVNEYIEVNQSFDTSNAVLSGKLLLAKISEARTKSQL
ncbi:hypothetical protein [Pseudocolwellia agarivorans]